MCDRPEARQQNKDRVFGKASAGNRGGFPFLANNLNNYSPSKIDLLFKSENLIPSFPPLLMYTVHEIFRVALFRMDFSHEVFLHQLAQTSGNPFLISIARAEGIYMYSPDGKQYMDMISGIGVSAIGHRHPLVI